MKVIRIMLLFILFQSHPAFPLVLRSSIYCRSYLVSKIGLTREPLMLFSTESSTKGALESFASGPQSSSISQLKCLDDFFVSTNSMYKYLREDTSSKNTPSNELVDGKNAMPRQIKNAHFTCLLPEKVKSPFLIATSPQLVKALQLSESEIKTDKFLNTFSGNIRLKGMDRPYATNYGCHSYGHWFGPLGDGRAIYLGETQINEENSDYNKEFGMDPSKVYCSLGIRELQLKGSGRTPFSRGFDGRAVLRSSIREFLASEAMHSLRVPTTRALSLVLTNEAIRRPWYTATSEDNPYSDSDQKFPPDVLIVEPGAIVCRVARSFLRMGHLELFGHRGELKELVEMADYVCLREYPHLLEQYCSSGEAVSDVSSALPAQLVQGPPERYVELFRCISKRLAHLVSEWLRVGYIQGNMNSDNTLLGGVTMDYGPFGWMEKFDPFYQPFTSDAPGKFSFLRQVTAMHVNVQVLGDSAFIPLIKHVSENTLVASKWIDKIKRISSEEFGAAFSEEFDEMRRKKLGFSSFEELRDGRLWQSLLQLMHRDEVDYIICFRELAKVNHTLSSSEALSLLKDSFYKPLNDASKAEWIQWVEEYQRRLAADPISPSERVQLMNSNNPKFVLRNWMGTQAYESSEQNDHSLVHELQSVLSQPYEEQSRETSEKWYRKTPAWAQKMPGVAFFSCSS